MRVAVPPLPSTPSWQNCFECYVRDYWFLWFMIQYANVCQIGVL